MTNLHNEAKCPNSIANEIAKTVSINSKKTTSNYYYSLAEQFIVIKIKPDGHCGFNSIMKILTLKNVKFKNVLSFRICISKLFDQFKEQLLKDMAFKSVMKKKVFEDKLKARIYRQGMSEYGCGKDHWMQDYTTIPVIACMFPGQKFMTYCPKNNHTSIWIKERNSDKVTNHFGNYFIHPEKESVCILFDGISHYHALSIIY